LESYPGIDCLAIEIDVQTENMDPGIFPLGRKLNTGKHFQFAVINGQFPVRINGVVVSDGKYIDTLLNGPRNEFMRRQPAIGICGVGMQIKYHRLAVYKQSPVDRVRLLTETHTTQQTEPMSKSQTTIKCPDCGHEFDISDVLYDQVEHDLKKDFEAQLKIERQKNRSESDKLNRQKEQLEKAKSEQEETINRAIREKLETQTRALTEKISADLRSEQSEQLKALQQELHEKSAQVKDLNKAKADIERLKREKDEVRGKAEAEMERKLSQQLSEERQKIKESEEERSSKLVTERDQLIRQLKEQMEIMKRKAEQGSTQLQGEVQELIIEEWLSATFPLDTIEEIKKGARGADCIQTINTRSAKACGRIYYESKRTKAFQPGWIEKFKADIREKGANIGVLVTESMPADMDRMGYRDGIWICSFPEFKGLSNVLRESIISMHRVVSQQENRGDKMSMVYDFLTSDEFRLQVEAIVEGFTQMKTDLDSEKRAMASIWKKREKQIEKVLINTSDMYSSIKGIAGNAVPAVRLLELPEAAEEEEDEET